MTPRFDPVAGGELSARNNRCTMRPFEERSTLSILRNLSLTLSFFAIDSPLIREIFSERKFQVCIERYLHSLFLSFLLWLTR